MRTTTVAALLAFAAACDQGASKPSGPAPTQTAETAPLKAGDMAPDVELSLQTGKAVKLSSMRGKLVALYFYPKDQTPGCTVEAQGMRDKWDELKTANVMVIGISAQDAAS